MNYSITAGSDHYCYPNTSILINKYNIRDEESLSKIEAVVVSTRIAEWLVQPQDSSFGFEHYKKLHHYLFSDLYSWAGEVRDVHLNKKQTHFCPPENLAYQGNLVFQRLQQQHCFQNLPHKKFVSEIVDFYCTTNELHPFREGNGRTQRTFLTQLIHHAAYQIDFAEIDADLLMIATIQSAQGMTDLLEEIFLESIRPLNWPESVNSWR